MNKLYRLPLRTRTKNLSSGVRRRQNSSKILATGILALCGLAALVAIGFAAFLTYKHMKGKPKALLRWLLRPLLQRPARRTFFCRFRTRIKRRQTGRCRAINGYAATDPLGVAFVARPNACSDTCCFCRAASPENRFSSGRE